MQVDNNGKVDGINRKDNTGYDVKHLFIGSEGTLGVITKVAIECPPLPSSKHAAMLVCSGYADVLRVVKEARSELGEVLSALEVVDSNTMSCVKRACIFWTIIEILRNICNTTLVTIHYNCITLFIHNAFLQGKSLNIFHIEGGRLSKVQTF